MKKQLLTLAAIFTFALTAIPGLVSAGHGHDHHASEKSDVTTTNSLVGVQGYDLVSYHVGAPVKGDGGIVSVHDGVTYVFSSAENKKTFEASPAKYLPAYGGYCAYGVSKGKKFIGDPNVWKVVDGKLYLNLNKKVQGIWEKDVPGNITEADGKWTSIKDVAADKL